MINIQKQVILLSDFHFKEFAEYLQETNAVLPHKLITTIRKLKAQPESDELCKLIYGDAQEKTRKKFLQLTHHTFKLSGFVSRNYPNYLKHNILLLEELLSKGEKKKANELAEWIIDIAEKIEDFTSLIEVYKFLSQQAFISESKKTAGFHKKIAEYVELERIKNSIYEYLREHAFFKGKGSITKAQLNKDLAFFDQYINHKSNSINILARYGKYHELSFLNHPDFFKKETLKELNDLERDFLNNAHVCFNYLDDIYFNLLAQKLQHEVNTKNVDTMLVDLKKMNNSSSFLKYWKSYVNDPELFSISAQTSYYISTYGHVYKDNYHKTLPSEVSENLKYLRKRLEGEIAKNVWDDGHVIKLIHVKCLYAAILLTGNEKDKIECVKSLENTLISYQQIPFQKFLDGIFATLVMGYFSLKQYDKVVSTYKRYKKITSDQIVVKENDLTIDLYYFTAQYLTNKRNQYIEKIKTTYNNAESFAHVRDLAKDITQYYSIPVNLG